MIPMKLLKLVYIAHGWSLGLCGEPLLGEQAQAWKYGPVVPSAYYDFRHWKHAPIESQKALLTERGEYIVPTIHDTKARELLERVWERYKQFDGLQLSEMTHQPGTPWDITRRQSNANEPEIPQNLLMEYYRRRSLRYSA